MAISPFSRIVRGLGRTRDGLAATLRSVFRAHVVDEATLDDLEATLLSADLGPTITMRVLDAVREGARAGATDGNGLRTAVRTALLDVLPEAPPIPRATAGPHVVFVVGVNGGGKTTTIGKLAARERAAGRRVLVVAADTFRAAAVDQLQRWAERAGVELVRQREGADPAAVLFDALRAAVARGSDLVLVDTAGRLHTKTGLMEELGKLVRVARKEHADAPHETLLVIDATTGQNGLLQAEEFARAAPVTGVVLTKLDGTAKGGIALAIRDRLGIPIRWVGVGESVDDLAEFDREAYVDGLLGDGTG
jgi:fused signal recognition particle receptor